MRDTLYDWYQWHRPDESPFGPNGESGLDLSDEELEREYNRANPKPEKPNEP